MNQISVNTFIGGMSKDVDKSIVPSNKYIDAQNYRVITTDGNTTGSLENVKGNKFLLDVLEAGTDLIAAGSVYLVVGSTGSTLTYNGVVKTIGSNFTGVGGVTTWTTTGTAYPILITSQLVDGYICGGIQIREKIILFVTENTSASPVTGDGDSRIYELVIDLTNETQSSLTLLYDDSLNTDSSDLCFSTANPIRAISKYETPNVQKVYWTDGYNHIRYCNIESNLTVDGTAYGAPGDYMSVDKFEFLPKFISSKPILKNVVGGYINTGMVAYSYQLYRMNGAETSFSPLSDPIHVTSKSDFSTNTKFYRGDKESVNSGKGFILEIDNTDNQGYNRLRLIRINYSYFNSAPEIFIANEIEIDTAGSVITITDIGDTLGEITLDEFNITSTELFKCQDIAAKDNRLFAANIDKSDFIVDAWDSRAVRYRSWVDPAQVPTPLVGEVFTMKLAPPTNIDIFAYLSNIAANSVEFTIPNFTSYLRSIGESYNDISIITAVNSIVSAGAAGTTVLHVEYADNFMNLVTYNVLSENSNITVDSFVLDTLIFTIQDTSGNIFLNLDTIIATVAYRLSFDYDLDEYVYIIDALVEDTVPADNEVIDVPASDDLAGWNAAGWSNYGTSHDGINPFNDPDNDGDDEFGYKYLSDGVTVGAEGLNVKIDFATESFVLDNSNDDTTFYTTAPTDTVDLAYTNYAGVWKGGKLSWQRDEIYRLFVVFGNDRGQLADPKWICDLRMPSLHDDTFVNSSSQNVLASSLASRDAGTGIISSYRLFPRVYLKSFPANATSAQIYRVKRERKDRSVVTQGLAVATFVDPLDWITYRPYRVYNPFGAAFRALPNNGKLFKLISPEINILNNISFISGDYLEYATNYSADAVSTELYSDEHSVAKFRSNSRVPFTTAVKTTINDCVNVDPNVSKLVGSVNVDSNIYNNYEIQKNSKSSTGLVIAYTDNTWSAETVANVIVNYKSNVYGSQYGGYTYEDRMNNISIPCSDIIVSGNVAGGILHWNDINYGDTFINYFDVADMLANLTSTSVSGTASESVYIPLESSINCDLRICKDTAHLNSVAGAGDYYRLLRQEYAGTHTITGGVTTYTLEQEDNLYLYNTVYSQQIDLKQAISLTVDKILETKFDCMIKTSNNKANGEITDSWTKFPINDFIEVDSIYGPVNALNNFNNRLFYYQNKAFGLLSINDRSLIQDSNSSQLVLGTGGVLDRFDYVSTIIGCRDKFGIANGITGSFWYDRTNNYIVKYSDSIDKVSMSKGIQSYLTSNVLSTQSVIAHADINNNEILFTFFIGGTSATATAFTIAYSENIDAFTSFYSFIPNIYIPYDNRYLTTTRDKYCGNQFGLNYLFLHDSDIYPRCNFYGLYSGNPTRYFTSTLKTLFNAEYNTSKVFDDLLFSCNVYANDIDLYNQSLNSIRCYNDFQNTDYVTLTYKTNLERRERGWTTFVPRNVVGTNLTSNPNIFDAANLTNTTRLFRERLRDKYMMLDTVYTNAAGKDKIVLNNLAVKYRTSFR